MRIRCLHRSDAPYAPYAVIGARPNGAAPKWRARVEGADMSALAILKAARAAGIELALDGEDLVLEAPSQPPRAVLDLLARHKASIVRLLRPAKVDGSIRHSERLFEQRAGIIEYDRLAPRIWAEALARLDLAQPPGDVPPKSWLRFKADCSNFL